MNSPIGHRYEPSVPAKSSSRRENWQVVRFRSRLPVATRPQLGGEFFGYFMVRKVIAGQELLRATGMVTKKLATWLYEKSDVSEDEWELAVRRGAEAARDLPRAERFATLGYEQVSKLTLEHASCACMERRCTCSRFGSCSNTWGSSPAHPP